MPTSAALGMPMLAAWETPRAGGARGFRWGGVGGGRHGAGLVVEYLGDGGAGGGFVDEGLVGGEGGDEGLQGEVVDGAGVAAAGGGDQVHGVLGEELVGAAGEFEVVGDVAAGLGGGHAGHGVAQRGPLLERGQDG